VFIDITLSQAVSVKYRREIGRSEYEENSYRCYMWKGFEKD
jgi:hypothetical protein